MTPVWAAIQHAVILRLVNSQPGQPVTQVVRLAVQVIVSWLQRPSYAGSPRMIGAMSLSFVLVTRQHAQPILRCQMVRILPPLIRAVLISLQGRSCGSGGLSCADGICTSLDREFSYHCAFTLTGSNYSISSMPVGGFYTRAGQGMRREERQVLPSLMSGPRNAQPVRCNADNVGGWFPLRCAQLKFVAIKSLLK